MTVSEAGKKWLEDAFKEDAWVKEGSGTTVLDSPIENGKITYFLEDLITQEVKIKFTLRDGTVHVFRMDAHDFYATEKQSGALTKVVGITNDSV